MCREVYGSHYVGIFFKYPGKLILVAAVQFHERKRLACNLLYTLEHFRGRVGEVIHAYYFVASIYQFNDCVGTYVSCGSRNKYSAFVVHFVKFYLQIYSIFLILQSLNSKLCC